MKNMLAFLNLLEADKSKISISNVMMWASVFMTIWMTIFSPEYIAEALTALGVSTVNYVAKRHITKGE